MCPRNSINKLFDSLYLAPLCKFVKEFDDYSPSNKKILYFEKKSTPDYFMNW